MNTVGLEPKTGFICNHLTSRFHIKLPQKHNKDQWISWMATQK